jgi:hypothetical protein
VVLVVVISVIVWIDDPDSGTVAKSDVELPDSVWTDEVDSGSVFIQ